MSFKTGDIIVLRTLRSFIAEQKRVEGVDSVMYWKELNNTLTVGQTTIEVLNVTGNGWVELKRCDEQPFVYMEGNHYELCFPQYLFEYIIESHTIKEMLQEIK